MTIRLLQRIAILLFSDQAYRYDNRNRPVLTSEHCIDAYGNILVLCSVEWRSDAFDRPCVQQ